MDLPTLTQIEPQQYTILVVDDNTTNLKIIVNYLRDFGFRILTASSGESALKRVSVGQPDIVLLDVMMPGIDGFETCRRLKADEQTRDIPVIFMTALATTADKITGFEVGAVDYVTKPIQQEEVLARLKTHLMLQEQKTRLQQMAEKLQAANQTLTRRSLQLETSSQVAQQLTSILKLQELLPQVIKLIQSRFGYYFVGVWLLDQEQEQLVLQAASLDEELPGLEPGLAISLAQTDNILTNVHKSGQPQHHRKNGADTTTQPVDWQNQAQAQFAVPLRVGSKQVGVLDIHSQQENGFDEEERQLLFTLANNIAIAIRNAQLYARQRNLRHMEEQKAHELARLNADKDRLFSIVAHDLRGPFQPVLGFSKLLPRLVEQPDIEQEALVETAQSIYRSANNVHNLLENLLQWARTQLGHIEYQPETLELHQLVEKTFQLLSDVAANKNIHLSHTIPPDTLVYADENMLEAVIRNLTSNALKFTPSGGQVTISTRPAGPAYLEISVADTGVGIEPEDLDKLFQVSTIHSTKGTDKEQGTGLGLIICQEMVEKNAGRIWIESEVGQGTTVKFTIPIGQH